MNQQTANRDVIQEELDGCEAALRGETVNGAKMGDAGITREWLENTRDALQLIINNRIV